MFEVVYNATVVRGRRRFLGHRGSFHYKRALESHHRLSTVFFDVVGLIVGREDIWDRVKRIGWVSSRSRCLFRQKKLYLFSLGNYLLYLSSITFTLVPGESKINVLGVGLIVLLDIRLSSFGVFEFNYHFILTKSYIINLWLSNFIIHK